MGLKEQLLEDMRDAMRAKDIPRRNAIRMVRAAIQNAEIAKQADLDEEEILSLIAKEIRQRRDAIEMFAKGNRPDLVEKESEQVEILQAYLPKQLSEGEIEAIAREVVSELGASGMGDMGSVMRATLAKVKGRADGRLVNEIARKLLSS